MDWRALAALDTQGIHDYVFGNSELSQIRGASEGLHRCTVMHWQALAKRLGGETVFCAGGNALVVFEAPDRGRDFCRSAEAMLARATGHVRTAWHVEERKSNEDFPGDEVTGIRARALARIEVRKQSGESPTVRIWNPFAKFCDLCGTSQAEESLRKVARPGWVCRKCALRGVRHGFWFRKFQEWASNNAAYGPEWAQGLKEAADLNEIAGQASPDGYLAFIYLDINDLGARLRSIGQIADYKTFSSAIQESTSNSVMAALADLLPVPATTPFEIFLMGGDDAVLAVPAGCAMDVVNGVFDGFGREFRRHIANAQGGKAEVPLMSAGVVYAHSHFPVHVAIRRAEELLRSAKRRAHAVGSGESAIDYLTITNSVELPVDRLRREQFQTADGLRLLVSRPLTRTDLAAIRKLCEILKPIPRSKLNALYDLLFRQRYQADLDYCYWLARLEKDTRQVLQRYCADRGIFASPFDANGVTPFVDAIELLSFGG